MSPPDPSGAAAQTGHEASRLLRLAEIGFRAGKTELGESSLARLGQMLPLLDDVQINRFLTLAERTGHPALTAAAIRHIAGRPVIQPDLALTVLRRAHIAEDPALADALEAALEDRVPAARRLVFIHQAARLRRGPEAAYRRIRQDRQPSRTPAQAAMLAELMIASARSRLALRYLRRCSRQWPNAPEIARLLLNACLQCGEVEAAQACLRPTNAQGGKQRMLETQQVQVAVQMGALEQVYEMLSVQVADGRLRASDQKWMRTLIALGRVEEAEAASASLRNDPGQALKYASHFSAMLTGQLLNDLRMYRRFHPEGKAPGRDAVARYFFAAKEVLDSWQAAPARAGGGAPPPVPRRIFQYWDADQPPAAVAEVMASWQGHPGWEHRLLNRRSAIDWLRRTFGPSHARAFTMASHVAEESDFLRLCLLWSEGGIYADADDKLVAPPDELLAYGGGLVVFREPYGALSNNLICAAPGHPAVAYAMKMARVALLRRDRDSIWLKTGPGLLTRATALHILENPEAAAADVTVVPKILARRQIHPNVALPYKSTGRYWNAKGDQSNRLVETALRAFADPQGSGPAGAPGIMRKPTIA